MARRLFNGRRFSENGWPYVDADGCQWGTVPGTAPPVSLQTQTGPPTALILAWAADWNAYIEPLRDADSACWTPGNSVATSNHPGGTACDLNWVSHRFGVSMSGFNAAQQSTMKEMEDFYEGNMFWAQRWFPASYVDPMHSQVGYDTYDQDADAPTPKVLDFIRRKIRADGFSTFRRGGTVTPPPPPQPASNAANVLARATDITIEKAAAILAQVSFALVACNCTNPRRIAAALAQWVIESGHFVYTEEIADGPADQERWKYKGRTWIQLTWLESYEGFSAWVHGLGLVPDPEYFVDRPRELADQKWAALGPAYWWAIKYPAINEYADRGDIDNVSKWVNAPAWVDNPNKHANDEKPRRDAYNRALALGDELLTLINTTAPGDDFMSALTDSEQREVLDLLRWLAAPNTGELRKKFPSRSPLRHTNEGFVETLAGFILNIDAHEHVELVRLLAGYNDAEALALLREVAATTEPGREHDAQFAQAILAELTPLVPQQTAALPQVHVATAEPPPTVVYRDVQPPTSTGQVIGQAYDALVALKSAQTDLDPQAKASVDALINVLQTEAGAPA